MNPLFNQLLHWLSGSIRRKNGLLAFLVTIGLCLLPWLSVPSGAESPDVGILLHQDTQPEALSRSEASLLLTLKQVNQNFSTIQLKELTNFKGKLLFIPLFDDTPKAFLETIEQQRSADLHYVLLPMLQRPSSDVESFITKFGFTVEGSQFLSRSFPLRTDYKVYRTYVPIGTFVFKVSAKTPALASWGIAAPAAVISGKTMLINWNWSSPLPELDYQRFMQEWEARDASLALDKTPNTAVAGAAFASNATNNRISPELPAQEIRKSFLNGSPTQTVNAQADSPIEIPVQTFPPRSLEKTQPAYLIEASPVVTPSVKSESAPIESESPATTPPATTAKSSPPVKAVAEMEEDANPAEMYEFDDGSKREAIRKQRGIDTQTAIAEFYNDRMRELADLQDKVNLLAVQYLNVPDKYNTLKSAIETADQQKGVFETAWFQRNYGPALSAFERSKASLMKALFNQVPVTQIEGRAIWLDRGSIVKAGSPEGLRELIRRISASGFNIIYFETVNAGYPIYPSEIVEQNPHTKGWDPLAIAVDEAHKQGVELHAWVWTFAVGNTRHNKILGQPDSFPGPILSKADMMTEALRGRNGSLIPPKQTEYWLSPASFKARGFLTSLFSEIVKNYKVDGLQLDYIRYPFQKPDFPMGFESFATTRFSSETGLSLAEPNEYTIKAWDAWKAFQVTSFVKDLNHKLKALNPELKISVAVFPMARHGRMLMIQQDWETWVRNGWVDTINPMAYSRSARSLEHLVKYIHNIGDDKALVYPGLSLQKLNSVELLDTLQVCRNTGVMGTTLFAMTQFDSDKQMMLQTGPYKQRKTIPPHRQPLAASEQLISETQGVVTNLLQSDRPKPGIENLQQISQFLSTIGTAVHDLNTPGKLGQTGFLISNIHDDSRMLKLRAEQWAEWNDADSVTKFQAKILKQMVDKVVRMVNYATFELSTSSHTVKAAN
jgi:uncharacterized lipoprotein YddW (UPF0748 family)